VITDLHQTHCGKAFADLTIVERPQYAMKPLPNIPEAVIPGTPFGIEVLKAMFVFACVVSLIASIPGLRSVRTEHIEFVGNHGLLSHLISLGDAVLFGIGFYGVHRRMRLAWRVGWFYLGLFYVLSIVSGMTASRTTMAAPERWIMFAAVVIGFSAVAVYWGIWWNKQKAYFRA
jgi:hypothetical protein